MEKVFNKVMQEFGLVEIDAQGKPLDPLIIMKLLWKYSLMM